MKILCRTASALTGFCLLTSLSAVSAFAPAPASWTFGRDNVILGMFDKMFEEEGPLGKGITVGKVQVALMAQDRGRDSIFGMLERKARSSGESPAHLAMLAKEVCLSLLRKSDDWVGAHSESKWFKMDDDGRAASLFNTWADRESVKFEKEYIPAGDSDVKGGGKTVVVVSLIIEIEGDQTKFDGAGYSMAQTKEVLSSIAADVVVEDGEVVNAVEVFWTPSERDEVLSTRDIIADFPEVITL